jgi:hypothetical protein
MSKLDVANAQIAYLKLWLSIMVVTDISLAGWIVSSVGKASGGLITAAAALVIFITFIAYRAHRNIERRIQDLEDL